MEVLLGYLLGVGTFVAIAKRGAEARGAVAWTARQVGALSGRVAKSLEETAKVAREEYERGRVEQLEKPLAEGLDVGRSHHVAPHVTTHLNGN